MLKQSLLVVCGLIFATSCVPQPRSLASSKINRPIADAQPLLQKLDLNVPTDDTGSLTDAAIAFARSGLGGAPPFIAAMRSADDERRAVDCLTQAIYYEARSEPVDGQRAVAQVVLNRVRDRAFPHSVCGVVFQGSERRTGCQFSFTCDGSMDRPPEPAAWERARSIATAALSGSVYVPVGSATHYHANYVLPWWASSLTRIGAVGSHIFYRWRGALEKALAFREDYSGSEPGYAGGASIAGGTQGAGTMGVLVHYANGIPATEPVATPIAGPIAALAAEGNVMVHRGLGTEHLPPPRMRSAAGVHVHVGILSDTAAAGDDAAASAVEADAAS